MARYLHLAGLFFLLLFISLSCGAPSNTNTPEYIKDLAIYREGEDGIFIYLVLADKADQPTASKGILEFAISHDNRVFEYIVAKVNTNDFQKANISMGPYNRDTIVLPIGRFTCTGLLGNCLGRRNNDLKDKEWRISLNFLWGEQPIKKYEGKYGRKEYIIGKQDKAAKVVLLADMIMGEMYAMKALENNKASDSGVVYSDKSFTF